MQRTRPTFLINGTLLNHRINLISSLIRPDRMDVGANMTIKNKTIKYNTRKTRTVIDDQVECPQHSQSIPEHDKVGKFNFFATVTFDTN